MSRPGIPAGEAAIAVFKAAPLPVDDTAVGAGTGAESASRAGEGAVGTEPPSPAMLGGGLFARVEAGGIAPEEAEFAGDKAASGAPTGASEFSE